MNDNREEMNPRPKSILVDTNLLLLLFLGIFDPSRIRKFKRTQQFSDADFQILVNFLNTFEKVVTTPHILTEVSNLGGQLGSDFVKQFFGIYSLLVQKLEEISRSSAEIVRSDLFIPLGLTDAAIGSICSPSIMALTDDSALARALADKGVQVLSFDVLRLIAAG
jgi:rRNA-processing protein FCF1